MLILHHYVFHASIHTWLYISSSSSISCACTILTMHMHAIGVPEGVTLLEFEPVLPEEQQQAQEQEVQAPEEGVNEEVLECPDHQPSSFLKGKPRSILRLLCFQNGYFEYLYLLMH